MLVEVFIECILYYIAVCKFQKKTTWSDSVHVGIVQEGPVLWMYELSMNSNMYDAYEDLWSICSKLHKQSESESLEV